SEIEQQADKISAVVQEGDESGSWELRKDAFTVAFNKASGEKTEINKNGIQIYEGGLLIKDKYGKNIMGFGDGVATVNDLYVTDGRDKYSWFYKSIAGMEEMEIQDVRIHKLVIKNEAFYIEDKKIGKGYDLKDYIETICYKMLKDQGLI
ncbi:endopeptidase, partial [Clostridium botulinum]|nr:endopeptidase [Clostridium botulinum]